MKIPVFDNIKFVDKEGYLTPGWSNILQELFQSLQADFSDEGLVIPSQTAADIAKLTDAPNWTVIGDTTNNALKIKIDDELRTIFSINGLIIPSLTATEIANMTDIQDWTLVGDTTNNLLKIRINGVWKSINTTP